MYFKYLRIGKVVNTHGIKGELRVIPLTENIERFEDLKQVYIDDEKLIKMDIEYVKYHKNFVLVKFKGIDSMNDAEKLKNTYVLIDRKDAVKLPENSYFIADLIDLNVYDENNVYLGKIQDVISTGSNDVYVVKSESNEILIPALKSIVKQISIEEGKMSVELPEGLI